MSKPDSPQKEQVQLTGTNASSIATNKQLTNIFNAVSTANNNVNVNRAAGAYSVEMTTQNSPREIEKGNSTKRGS